jgi:hypothetical protein
MEGMCNARFCECEGVRNGEFMAGKGTLVGVAR